MVATAGDERRERATRAILQELPESAPDGLVVVAADQRIVLVNRRLERMFGVDRVDLIGEPITILVPEDLRDAHAGHVEGYNADPHSRPMGAGLDLEGRRADGTHFPVEISLSPLETPDGRFVIAAVRDVTARIEADAELARTRAELELTADRERIARDLHDTVIQRLFAAGMTLQGAAGMADESLAGRIGDVIDELDTTIREIRTAIFELQGPPPGAPSLRARVLDVLNEEEDALGVHPQVRFDGPVDTAPTEIADQLVATLREALSNVSRHARATSVSVGVAVDGEATLRVVDDGTGVPADPPPGQGLADMAARAARLGGSC